MGVTNERWKELYNEKVQQLASAARRAERAERERDAALRQVAALRAALEVFVDYADKTLDYWDEDQDSKVGKRLAWMAGVNQQYEPDLNERVHKALADTAAAAEAYERSVREPLKREIERLKSLNREAE